MKLLLQSKLVVGCGIMIFITLAFLGFETVASHGCASRVEEAAAQIKLDPRVRYEGRWNPYAGCVFRGVSQWQKF